ncbi:MAG: hypothetical protein HZA50_13830 [Planctomycetes bacterium]|nr:hypothetical protein [Planctomycetota bacterium]
MVIVSGGVVQSVYSDAPDEDVKVLDFDDARESEVSAEQMTRELRQVERDMYEVL